MCAFFHQQKHCACIQGNSNTIGLRYLLRVQKPLSPKFFFAVRYNRSLNPAFSFPLPCSQELFFLLLFFNREPKFPADRVRESAPSLNIAQATQTSGFPHKQTGQGDTRVSQQQRYPSPVPPQCPCKARGPS